MRAPTRRSSAAAWFTSTIRARVSTTSTASAMLSMVARISAPRVRRPRSRLPMSAYSIAEVAATNTMPLAVWSVAPARPPIRASIARSERAIHSAARTP